MFYGAWLILLAYSMARSALFPKALWLLVAIAGFGHLVCSQVNYVVGREFIPLWIYWVATIGEFALCLWLLVFGARRHPPA